MSKDKIKKITFYSFILGIILGVITLIPFLQYISVIVMSVLSSVIVTIFMERKKQINRLSVKGAGLIGGYIGFICLAGFLSVYLPLSAILGAIVHYLMPNNIYFSGIKFLIQIWWLLLFMGGLITTLFNSFALISYTYIKDTYFMIEKDNQINGNFESRGKNGI